jgi:iron(III) transport system ATP-binding protein
MDLRPDAVTVLLGATQAGKTSLMRIMAGLDVPSTGRVVVDGVDVVGVPVRQRNVSMVYQQFINYPSMTVFDNIASPLHLRGETGVRERVHALAEKLHIEMFLERYPSELSGGQQQRVALARALAPQPQLLLLDEPFSNLDVDLRERLAQELRDILKAANATALFVTHDQLEAFAIGDVIGVMHEGHLHQWADAYTLYHRPATRFVADFIGHGVFAPATVRQQGSQWLVSTPLGEFADDVAEEAGKESVHAGPCDVLLRADDIVHDDDAPVKAEIVRKAFRGSEFLYTLRLRSGETVLAHVPSHHDHKIGEWIGIRAEVDHVVTFARS